MIISRRRRSRWYEEGSLNWPGVDRADRHSLPAMSVESRTCPPNGTTENCRRGLGSPSRSSRRSNTFAPRWSEWLTRLGIKDLTKIAVPGVGAGWIRNASTPQFGDRHRFLHLHSLTYGGRLLHTVVVKGFVPSRRKLVPGSQEAVDRAL
jgi:hypothetical protein